MPQHTCGGSEDKPVELVLFSTVTWTLGLHSAHDMQHQGASTFSLGAIFTARKQQAFRSPLSALKPSMKVLYKNFSASSPRNRRDQPVGAQSLTPSAGGHWWGGRSSRFPGCLCRSPKRTRARVSSNNRSKCDNASCHQARIFPNYAS